MKKNILMFCLILLVNSAFMLNRNIGSLDELWNYNFARNICDGLLPYKDFNMIPMPLYPAIVAIFLKLIANELIVARIVAIVVFTIIMFIGYKILDKLIENKWLPILGILGLLFIYKGEFWGDYNFAVLLITFLVMFLELKNIKLKLNTKYDLCLGIIVGLAIITKQTTGLVLAFTFVIYKWTLIRSKQDFIEAFKISIARGIGILVPVLAFVGYLIFTNTMHDFIDYSIKGISEFKSTFPYEELLNHPEVKTIFKIIGGLVPILFVLNTALFFKTRNMNLFVLLIFSLQNMIVVYPLCDVVHFLVGSLPILVTSIYSIYIISKKYINKAMNNTLEFLVVIAVAGMVGFSVFTLCQYAKKIDNKAQHFAGVHMNENLYDAMVILTDYVKEKEEDGKEVYIITMDTVLPMIMLDKYHKDYDMLVKGNIGSKGEEGIIEDIEKKNNAIFIIETEPSLNRQSPEKVRTFIQNNYEQIDTILIYGVFEKQ